MSESIITYATSETSARPGDSRGTGYMSTGNVGYWVLGAGYRRLAPFAVRNFRAAGELLDQPQGASPRFEPGTHSNRGLAPCG
jgi:hypothetical protein